MAPSVLLIGASGSLGVPLVEEFIRQKSKFERIAILADPSRAKKFEDVQKRGIDVVTGSFLDPNSYKGFSVVISLAGNPIMRLQPAMIEAAVAAGVRHFYPSEFGVDVGHDDLVDFRYLRDKRVTRDHLVAKAKEVPGFRYTLLMNGIFAEWSAIPPLGVDTDKHTSTVYGTPDAILSLTAVPDIVRYIVESVLLPFENDEAERQLRVIGQNVSHAELLDILEEIQGSKYDRTYLPLAEAAEKQDESRKKGDEASVLYWSLRQLQGSGNGRVPGPWDNDKFSFKPESARETIQRIYGKN
ncbi:NAD(P)-binding protein [Xylona heveae TC161]|uniref:NAD(P)-binding protein n=1 Tax=Xylona heveae (strain CBS 132557 / TC161) TaxID=1328760 RepID=A0A165J2V7_XYLHT|nr:NAD(P)-binding protein [Xylona heveae TC161]KZF25654.1 NAD(P)-binding protein [Xylona heveae TC161]